MDHLDYLFRQQMGSTASVCSDLEMEQCEWDYLDALGLALREDEEEASEEPTYVRELGETRYDSMP